MGQEKELIFFKNIKNHFMGSHSLSPSVSPFLQGFPRELTEGKMKRLTNKRTLFLSPVPASSTSARGPVASTLS